MNNTFTAGLSYQQTITMVTEECITCGIVFGMPSDFKASLKAKGSAKTFYCPNGHSMVYTKSDAERVKEQMEAELNKSRRDYETMQNNFLDEMNKRQKLEKTLKAVHKGKCPCCRRTFQNLQNHMKTKHPELVPASKPPFAKVK